MPDLTPIPDVKIVLTFLSRLGYCLGLWDWPVFCSALPCQRWHCRHTFLYMEVIMMIDDIRRRLYCLSEQNITYNSPDISQVSTIHLWLIQLRVWKSEHVLRYRCLVAPIVTSAPSGLDKTRPTTAFTCFNFRLLDYPIKWLHVICIVMLHQ